MSMKQFCPEQDGMKKAKDLPNAEATVLFAAENIPAEEMEETATRMIRRELSSSNQEASLTAKLNNRESPSKQLERHIAILTFSTNNSYLLPFNISILCACCQFKFFQQVNKRMLC